MTGARCVGIVDYQAGNLHSIRNAFEHLGVRTIDVRDADGLAEATHVVLPGVGAFGHCADNLRATGLIPLLEERVVATGRPLLGICVGMQLLADRGEELGDTAGLGWVGGAVRGLHAAPPQVRVPHVGWNDVRFLEPFGDWAADARADFYFDHSYAYRDPVRGRIVGECRHGEDFAAIVRHGNVIGAQFHPEKSQEAGLRFLSGFLAIPPC